VLVREATPDDARAIAEVHVASWRWAYREILPEDFLERLSVDDRETMWRDLLADRGPGGGVAVAEDERGRVVGFAGYGPPEHSDEPEGTGELYAIYLREEVVGTGVGEELFEEAVEGLRAAGYRRAILWVFEANPRARRFYERAGWRWDGTVSEHRLDCGNRPIVRYVAEL
jgi:RimJ/RimL family protein N-acetyltransferase